MSTFMLKVIDEENQKTSSVVVSGYSFSGVIERYLRECPSHRILVIQKCL